MLCDNQIITIFFHFPPKASHLERILRLPKKNIVNHRESLPLRFRLVLLNLTVATSINLHIILLKENAL